MVADSDIKAAIYLVNQGPYREPRMMDLQYFRILRYADAMNRILGTDIDIVGVYCDYNYPKQNLFYDPSKFPGLKALMDAFARGEFGTVLLDVEFGRAYRPYEWDALFAKLKAAEIPFYNAFTDDMLKKDVVSRFGKYADYDIASITEAEDMVTFFPALACSMAEELLKDLLDRSSPEHDWIRSRLHHIAKENTYQTRRPEFSRRFWGRIDERRKEERAQRKLTETLYKLGPDDEGHLLEDNLAYSNEPRNEEGLAWAENRVCKVFGLPKVAEGRTISYQATIKGLRVFADIRSERTIVFYVYPPDDREKKKGRRKGKTPLLTQFKFADTLKNNLRRNLVAYISSTAISRK